jgi:diguanylate cyclase (GGDEF)-like protein
VAAENDNSGKITFFNRFSKPHIPEELREHCRSALVGVNRHRFDFMLPPVIIVLIIIIAVFFIYYLRHDVEAQFIYYYISVGGYTLLLLIFYLLSKINKFQTEHRFNQIINCLCFVALGSTAILSVVGQNMTTYIITLFILSTLFIINIYVFVFLQLATAVPLLAIFSYLNMDSISILSNYANVFFGISVSAYISHIMHGMTMERAANRIIIERQNSELSELLDKFKFLSETDGLTKIYNRRKFDEIIRIEWKRATRKEYSLALILFDVDFFKNYNDKYGHLKGDDCLVAIGETVKALFGRANEFAARYGGEEFAIILAGADAEHGKSACKRLIEAIQALKIQHDYSHASTIVTISAGLAVSTPKPADSMEVFMKAADDALFQAKKTGRNRYVMADS